MMVYSLLETARANGLNPQKYLEYLLEARPNKNMSDGELENMAPWNPKVQECCVNKSQSSELGKLPGFSQGDTLLFSAYITKMNSLLEDENISYKVVTYTSYWVIEEYDWELEDSEQVDRISSLTDEVQFILFCK